MVPKQLARLATCATRAWTGSNPAVAKAQRKLQIFLCSWKNQHPEKTITSIDFERGTQETPAPFCLGITCDREAIPQVEEPGLLIVDIGRFAGNNRYSVLIGNSPGPPLKGVGQHNVVLPPARHAVKLRDGETVVHSGSIQVTQGGIAFVVLDAQSTLFALPTTQPDPKCELTGQLWGIFDCALSRDGEMLATAAGDGTVVLRRREGNAWRKHTTVDLDFSVVRSVAFSPTSPLLAIAGQAAR